MTKIELAYCFFYLGEPARLRRSRFQAPQTPIYVPTSGNVVPSRRAVGLFATMFFVIRHRRGCMRYAPTNNIFCMGVSHAPSCQKTFPLQSLSRARSRHLPVSRRTIQSLRLHLFPAPRTPLPDLLSKKWEHCPHLSTDMQPQTRLVAVSSSSGPAGRRVCEEMCMSLQNNGLKP